MGRRKLLDQSSALSILKIINFKIGGKQDERKTSQTNIGQQRDHNKSTDVDKSNICTFFDFVLYTFKKIFVIMMKQFNLYYLMLFSDKQSLK